MSLLKRPRNAPGHRAGGKREGAGRKPALDAGQRTRLAHWRTWWATRPALAPSAAALAACMEQAAATVRDYAAARRDPGPVALLNLESLSAGHGYLPLTADYLFL